MATRLRGGTVPSVDSHLLHPLLDARPDPEPVRLVTRLHVGDGRPRTAAWRVVAELMDGHRRLVCVGNSPHEARAAARQAARDGDLPPHVVALRTQRWVGKAAAGSWEEER